MGRFGQCSPNKLTAVAEQKKEISFGIKVREDSNLKPPIYVNQFRVLNADGLVHLFVNFNYSGQNLFTGLILVNESTITLNKESISPYFDKLLNSNPQEGPTEEAGFAGGRVSGHRS